MTEPLLFATTQRRLALIVVWIERGRIGWPHAAGAVLAAACLTRYEAWPITAAAVVLAAAVLLRRGASVRRGVAACVGSRPGLPLAIVLFLINSRWTVGAWFVSGGFFVAENIEALGHPLVAWQQVREGLYRLSGTGLVWSAYAGSALIVLASVSVSSPRAPRCCCSRSPAPPRCPGRPTAGPPVSDPLRRAARCRVRRAGRRRSGAAGRAHPSGCRRRAHRRDASSRPTRSIRLRRWWSSRNARRRTRKAAARSPTISSPTATAKPS